MKKFLKSKRFFVLILSMVVYVVGVWIMKSDPVSIATGITLITAPYIAGETFRKSESQEPRAKNQD